jgi:predicted nucleic acid-binding protein
VREDWLRTGLRQFEQLLGQFPESYLVALSDEIVEQAVSLMARFHLKSFDAIHVATAMAAGVDAIAAIDADFERVADLPVVIVRNPQTTDDSQP